jgi:hypothetical protein
MYSILLVLSVVGNGLVIAVVCCNKHLQTVFNYFIINMAVSDLFIPLLALPIKIVNTANGKQMRWLIEGALGDVTCKLFIFLIDISPAVSVISLVMIAVNRFVAIVYPMHYGELFSTKKSKILIALIWVAVTIIFSPYFYIFRISNDGNNMCIYEWSPPFDKKKSETIFFSMLVAVFFLIPFISITFLYLIIMYKMRMDSKTVVQMLDSNEAHKRKQRNKHIFYLSVAMIVAFAIFWGPFFVSMFMLVTGRKFPAQFLTIAQYLGYANSVVNPCIYFIFMKAFRNGCTRIFSTRCLKKKSDNLPNQDTRLILLTKADDNRNVDRLRSTNVTSAV